jgi:peptidoglycan/LPS O-acetylase OafA/YrhL
MSRSSLALSNLRGFAIVMVVAFHSLIAYLGSQPAAQLPFDDPPFGWRANPIVDSARWFGFDLFCALQYIYLMQLLFFLSGLFVWPSLSRKGARTFLYDRLIRLGVPFAVGLYVLMPIAYYPVYRVTAVDTSWSAFWSHWIALPFWPSGPMWFLWVLLLFNIVAAALFWLAPRAGEFLGRLWDKAGLYPGRFFLALVSICAVAYLPLSAVFAPWEWVQFGPFALQPSLVPQYAIYFFAGLGIGAFGLERGLLEADGLLAQRCWHWLAGTGAAFLLWIVPTALIVNGTTLPGLHIVADLGYLLCVAAACFALVGLFLRTTRRHRPILESFADNAYGIYLVHYVFVLWLQYSLLGVALFAVAKGAIVFAGALALSWATTAAMCRLPIGARVMGRKSRELVRVVTLTSNPSLPGLTRQSIRFEKGSYEEDGGQARG